MVHRDYCNREHHTTNKVISCMVVPQINQGILFWVLHLQDLHDPTIEQWCQLHWLLRCNTTVFWPCLYEIASISINNLASMLFLPHHFLLELLTRVRATTIFPHYTSSQPMNLALIHPLFNFLMILMHRILTCGQLGTLILLKESVKYRISFL